MAKITACDQCVKEAEGSPLQAQRAFWTITLFTTEVVEGRPSAQKVSDMVRDTCKGHFSTTVTEMASSASMMGFAKSAGGNTTKGTAADHLYVSLAS
jgi:hypothetical protein